ncbi:MAG: hypothetical protein QXL01_00375 [Thermoplasmatales archaeon]
MEHRRLRGPDLHSPSQELVVNETGSTIGKLKVVKTQAVGITSSVPAITISTGNNDRILGVVNADIPDTKLGYVTCWGFLTKLNTGIWPSGTLLYTSITGDLSSTPYGLPVATVFRQHATEGVIFVRTLGYNSSDLVTATDNMIITVALADWVSSDGGDLWSIDLVHNLGTLYPNIHAYLDSAPDEEIELHKIRVVNPNTTRISVSQAGVDGRFDGFIVLDK